jgi:hypothetical protein
MPEHGTTETNETNAWQCSDGDEVFGIVARCPGPRACLRMSGSGLAFHGSRSLRACSVIFNPYGLKGIDTY